MLQMTDISKTLRDVLDRSFKKALSSTNVSFCVQSVVRQHIQQKYPGSQHWSPSKVNAQNDVQQDCIKTGTAEIAIPGAGRAYHDVDIYPIQGKHLTIPLSFAARQSPAKSFSNLFKVGNVLMMKSQGQIQPMFALVEHVHQRQDSSLMPSDDVISKKISDEYMKNVATQLDNELMRC